MSKLIAFISSFIALFLVYRQWRTLGGDRGFAPPETWHETPDSSRC